MDGAETGRTDRDVGFIGIGIMGEPMALNLLRAGTPLLVWNRSAHKCEAVKAAGARVAASAEEVLRETDTTILMMASEAALDAVLARDTDGFARRVAARTIVHMGTVSPDYSRALERDIRAAGGRYVEAPVSGSRMPAQAGRLVAMLAGERAAVADVAPLLAPMCAETVLCGEVPAGLSMKLATNAVLLPLMAGLAEAFHVARGFGLDLEQFRSVLGGGQLASPISRVKAQKLAEGDFTAQAAVTDVLKNSRLAADAARGAGISAPLLDLCTELFDETRRMGFGKEDAVAVIKAIAARRRPPG